MARSSVEQSAAASAGQLTRSASALERASWWAVFVSDALLLAAMVFLGRPLWGHFVSAAVVAFAIGFAGMRVGRVPIVAVALALFVYPALCLLLLDAFAWPYHAMWMAAVLGAALGVRPYTWCLPRAFASPVALWALSLALVTPLIAAREADFTFVTLHTRGLLNGPTPPAIVVAFVVFVGAWTLTTLLWMDRLFALYSRRGWRSFALEIVFPLSVGWAIAAAVGLYQWRVDFAFLSRGFWVGLRRASGTFLDANPFGAVAAVWGIAVAGVALRSRRILPTFAAAAGALVVSWTAVWASGSRGAFGILAFGTVVIGIASARRLGGWTTRVLVVAAVIVVMVGGIWAARTTGPFERLVWLRFDLVNSPGKALRSLWERDGYGTASTRMIREHPWTGVGIGVFHTEVPDYGRTVGLPALAPDNAQNWYRHQLAELGIIGSIGWMLWVLVMAYALMRGPGRSATADLHAVRGALIAFGLMSTVAMPGQDVAVGMMIVTLAFWYLNGARVSMPRVERALSSRATWVGVWVIALCTAAVAIVSARDERPPFRAARFDQDYRYGIHLDGPSSAWTDARAVIVPNAPKPWVKLTYWIDHPDAASRPVRIRIWRGHERIVDRKLYNDVRTAKYVSVPGENRRFVLEVRVDRTFTPAGDTREHGLNVTWEFVDRAPQDQR